MSESEKPNGSGNWRGIDLSGKVVDPGKASVEPNGDIWENGTFMGNAYDINKSNNGFSGGSQDYDVMASVRIVIILGILIAIVCGCYTAYQRVSHWFKDVTGETRREQVAVQEAAQAKAEDDAQQVREIEGTQRYRRLAAKFPTRRAAQTALIQQDINLLDDLNTQANKTNMALQGTGTHTWSAISTASFTYVPVNGIWSRDWDWKAYSACKLRYAESKCSTPLNDTADVSSIFLKVDTVLQGVVKAGCFGGPDYGTPACLKVIAYLEMTEDGGHRH